MLQQTALLVLAFTSMAFTPWASLGQTTGARTTPAELSATHTAIVLIDFWERDDEFASLADKFACRAASIVPLLRQKGVLIVHAPSDVGDTYRGHLDQSTRVYGHNPCINPAFNIQRGPAYESKSDSQVCRQIGDKEITGLPKTCPASTSAIPFEVPCNEPGPKERRKLATRLSGQIDQVDIIADERDAQCINGRFVLAAKLKEYLRNRKIDTLLYAGLALDRCISFKAFGIASMRDGGFHCIIVRDLTDIACVNPDHRAQLEDAMKSVENTWKAEAVGLEQLCKLLQIQPPNFSGCGR